MLSRLGAAALHVVPEMPDNEDKSQQQFRLSAGVVRRLNALADEMEMARADVVDMAIKHLWGSRKRDIQPFVWDPPPPSPAPSSDPQEPPKRRTRRA